MAERLAWLAVVLPRRERTRPRRRPCFCSITAMSCSDTTGRWSATGGGVPAGMSAPLSSVLAPAEGGPLTSDISGTSLSSGKSGASVGRVLAVVPPVLEGRPRRALPSLFSSCSADSVSCGLAFTGGGACRRTELCRDDAGEATASSLRGGAGPSTGRGAASVSEALTGASESLLICGVTSELALGGCDMAPLAAGAVCCGERCCG